MPMILLLTAMMPLFSGADPKAMPLVGAWEGTLKVGAIELRVGIIVTLDKDGKYAGTMNSIDQGAKDIAIEKIAFADHKAELNLSKIGANFVGTLSDDGKRIQGEWKQGAIALPLVLERVEKLSELLRPQTPRKPYPYVEEEVVVENKTAQLSLAGTLTKPRGDGPFQAVILITGSGPQDRDETLLGHKPFLILADYLTRKGIAVLRVDDRGVGKSTGKFETATSADFATDIRACIAFLKQRKEINPKRIGLIGHSEGGMIAPMVAADNADVAFIVLLAGPGMPGDDLLILQGQKLMMASNADAKMLDWQRNLQTRLFTMIRAGADSKAVEAAFDAAILELPEASRKGSEAQLTAQRKASEGLLNGVWLRYFLAYNPRNNLAKVRCPVLALNGEKDVQVPPRENLLCIEMVLKAAGNSDVTIREFPGLNHLFQPCKTGLPAEYGKIEQTFAPGVLTVIGDWILKHQ